MKFILSLPPPPTHQAALRILKTRDGRQFIGKMAKSSAKKWSVAATLMMKSEIAQKGYVTIDGACYVTIKFYYPHTKDSKRWSVKSNQQFVKKCTRPDLDNLAKSVLDCLVDAGAIKDDGLIVNLILAKYYTDTEQVVVDIHSDEVEN
jgi:Holliday junction resolvase RusA-like endonuclease